MSHHGSSWFGSRLRPGPSLVVALAGAAALSWAFPRQAPAVLAVASGAAALWLFRAVEPRAPRPAPAPADEAPMDRFLYLVSHELTEPLRTAGAFTAILLDDHGDALGEEGRVQARFAADAVERMRARLEVLLTLSRAARGPRVPVDLGAALERARERTQGSASVTVQGRLPTVVADADALTELFTRVLQNAIDFSEGPAAVTVSAREEDGGTTVEIRDRGIGPDPAHLADAFTVFWARDPRSSSARMGVGLALCERIARRHGGWITLERAEPGAAVCFHLPATPGVLPP